MNKITLYLILFFTIIGIQKIQASATGATVNWTPTISTLQSTRDTLRNFAAVNGQSTNYMTSNKSSYDADGCIRPLFHFLTAIIDLYNQNIVSSWITPGWDSTQAYPMDSAVRSVNNSNLTNFYQSIKGVYTSSTIPDNVSKNQFINLNAVKQNTFITPSTYTNAALQYLKGAITDIANNLTQLSRSMVDNIEDNNAKISNNTSIDAASNPLNADILRCQVIQDLAFVCSNIFIYIANNITNTPHAATILYTPQISCSDTIATAVWAVINAPAGTSQATLLFNAGTGKIAATLIPTDPITFTITQITIYAAVCAFVLAYNANSTSGPYQSISTSLINANNALQIL